jgi:hypothetical protein
MAFPLLGQFAYVRAEAVSGEGVQERPAREIRDIGNLWFREESNCGQRIDMPQAQWTLTEKMRAARSPRMPRLRRSNWTLPAPVAGEGDQKPEPAAESPFGDAGDEVAEPDNAAVTEDTPVEN